MADKQEDPEYLFVNTGPEIERLRKQYKWMAVNLKGQLIFAPVDTQREGLKVLDVGCADGTVLRDMAKQLKPSAELVGVDIMPSFLPKSPAGNISYSIYDVCEPAPSSLVNAFDFTNLRFVLAGAARVGLTTAVANLASTVNSGGWLQVMELDTKEGVFTPAVHDLFFMMRALFNKIGIGENFAPTLEGIFKEVGLVNVKAQKLELAAGKKLGNEEDSKNSIEPFKITVPSLIAATGKLGIELPNSLTDKLAERFAKEMEEQGAVMTALVIVGQKQ